MTIRVGFPLFVKNSHSDKKSGVWGDEIAVNAFMRLLNDNGFEAESFLNSDIEGRHYDIIVANCYNWKHPMTMRKYADKFILWIQGFNYNHDNKTILDLDYTYNMCKQHYDLIITSARTLASKHNIPFILPPVDFDLYKPIEKTEEIYDIMSIANLIKPFETIQKYVSPMANFKYGLFGGDMGKLSHDEWIKTSSQSKVNLHYGFEEGKIWDMVIGSPLFLAAVKGFCLSDKIPWFMETFKDAMAFTDGGDDEREQIRYYLENAELREKMKDRAYEIVRGLDFSAILPIVKGV